MAKAEKSLAKRDAALLKQKREFEAEQEGHRGEQRSTRIALAEETHRMEQLRLDEQVAFQRELQQLQVELAKVEDDNVGLVRKMEKGRVKLEKQKRSTLGARKESQAMVQEVQEIRTEFASKLDQWDQQRRALTQQVADAKAEAMRGRGEGDRWEREAGETKAALRAYASSSAATSHGTAMMSGSDPSSTRASLSRTCPGRCGEMWGALGSSGEIWGDVGSSTRAILSRTACASGCASAPASASSSHSWASSAESVASVMHDSARRKAISYLRPSRRAARR